MILGVSFLSIFICDSEVMWIVKLHRMRYSNNKITDYRGLTSVSSIISPYVIFYKASEKSPEMNVLYLYCKSYKLYLLME